MHITIRENITNVYHYGIMQGTWYNVAFVDMSLTKNHGISIVIIDKYMNVFFIHIISILSVQEVLTILYSNSVN